MATPIFTHLEGSLAISRHEHVAVLYRDQSVAYRLVPFVAEGLRKGDLCQVIAAGAFQFETLKQLGTQLKDLDRHLEVGTLRLHQGPEDLRELRRLCKQLFADAEGAHSHGVRWLEDTGWLKTGKLPMPDFFAGLLPTWATGALSFALLGTIAVLSALYPARRAASIDPIEALRYEAGG